MLADKFPTQANRSFWRSSREFSAKNRELFSVHVGVGNDQDLCCGWSFEKAQGGDLIAAPISRVIAFAVLFAIGASVIPALRSTASGPVPTTDEWTTGTNWTSTPTVPDNTATFANNGAPTSEKASKHNNLKGSPRCGHGEG
jgi:hypothetical protein